MHPKLNYKSPSWLLGRHLQTIFPALRMPYPPLSYERELWLSPDDDCIAVDHLPAPQKTNVPVLVLWHGLEGSSQSGYARGILRAAQQQGWHGIVPHFRSCGGVDNRLARMYHAGDSQEIDWVIKRIKERYPQSPMFGVGVSLGGNALLKWLGENASGAQSYIDAAVSVSAPLDLCQAGPYLDRGINRALYTRFFLKTLKQKIQNKMQDFDYPFTLRQLNECQTFAEFDNLVTAPLHGFKDVWDYWQQSSSIGYLSNIKVPTLLLNAQNDPFLPKKALPKTSQLSPAVQAYFPASGGHVGFSAQENPTTQWLEDCIVSFFKARLDSVC